MAVEGCTGLVPLDWPSIGSGQGGGTRGRGWAAGLATKAGTRLGLGEKVTFWSFLGV